MSNSTDSSLMDRDLDDESWQWDSSTVILIVSLTVVGLLFIVALIKIITFVRSRDPRGRFNGSGKIEAGRVPDGVSSQNGRSHCSQVDGRENRSLCMNEHPGNNPSYGRTGWDLRRSDKDDGLYDDTEKYSVRDDPPGSPRVAVPHGVVGNPYDYPSRTPRAAVPHGVVGNPYDYLHGAPRAVQPTYDYPQHRYPPQQAIYDHPPSNPVPVRGGAGRSIYP